MQALIKYVSSYNNNDNSHYPQHPVIYQALKAFTSKRYKYNIAANKVVCICITIYLLFIPTRYFYDLQTGVSTN